MIASGTSFLYSILRDSTNKDILCHTDPELLTQLSFSTNTLFTYFATRCSKYEVAQIINFNAKYLKAKNSRFKFISYRKRQILEVELGARFNNLSYKHPCIVIEDLGDKLFVVPCTSGAAPRNKNNALHNGYLEGDVNDGFKHLTTIICKECTCIDKSQIVNVLKKDGKFKKISPEIFKKINEVLFENLFNGAYYKMSKMEENLKSLTLEKEQLEEEKLKLEEELNKIKSDNNKVPINIEIKKEVALE